MSTCCAGLSASYPDLIAPTRELLEQTGLPYVIENVQRSRKHLRDPVTLCGWMFGREHYRHRLLEAGGGLVLKDPPVPVPGTVTGHREHTWVTPGVDGSRIVAGKPDKWCGWPHPVPVMRAGHWQPGYFVSVSGHERKEAMARVMEVPWMRQREDVAECVPPYMARWAGEQIAEQFGKALS
jgi:DNA (cytosine-5)-methyltransferase 1